MKHDKLAGALSELDDRHIAEAMKPHRRYGWWLSAVAAVLVLAIGLGILLRPGIAPVELLSSRYAVAKANYPTMHSYPGEYDYDAYIGWSADQKTFHNQPEGYADSLQSCWDRLVPQLLSGSVGENTTCSPLNIYMALAILAECTGGESRQQILELLNADSIEAARLQANQVWKAHYNNDGLSKSVLGSSLWLEKDYGFDQSTADLLAENYFASVFRGDLGSAEMNEALHSWLNEQTNGLLQEQVQNVNFDPLTVLALATTIDYQVQWVGGFTEKYNTQGSFHGAKGDTTEPFMRTELTYGPYYWSDNFSAVYLPLEDNSRMWLLLPDEGVAPEDILAEAGAFFALEPYAYDSEYEKQKSMTVNLSVPKFDVASDMDLADKLQSAGITHIFQSGVADFSPILSQDDGGYVNQVKHATRVSIDEKGVTAAAFTVIDRCGAGMPPEEEIDFVLDRPFLFYIESQDGLPLFTGIVNEP